jgi:putative chitinase
MEWPKIIKAISPRAKANIVQGLAAAMPQITRDYSIDTKLDIAHFLAQCAHESDGFTTTVEYDSGDAYDTRTDLGFTKARDGDGRKYKGFGLIQTTGPYNQEKAARALGIYSEWKKNPRILATFPYAAISAGYYWKSRGLSKYAENDDIRTTTKKVNGGYNGLSDRKLYLARAKKALGISGDGLKPILDGDEPMPRDKVRTLQEQLKKRGYVELGAVDGSVGSKTVAAVSAFQHDNDLPITGRFDQATQNKLFESDEPRPIPESRAKGEPKDSRIVNDSKTLEKVATGSGAVIGGGKAIEEVTKHIDKVGEDPLGAAEKTTTMMNLVKSFSEAVTSFIDFLGTNWWMALLVLCVAVFFIARRIRKNRVEDYQTGKTA